MEFLRKYMILIWGLFLLFSNIFGFGIRTIGGSTFTIGFCILACYLYPEKKYLQKVVNCLRIGFLSILLGSVLILFISPLVAPRSSSIAYLHLVAEYLPFAISGLITKLILLLALAFIIPAFFRNTIEEREDILDM